MNNKSLLQQFLENSYLSGANAEYVEDMYEQYLVDPAQVEPQWRELFSSLPTGQDVSHRDIRETFKQMAKQPAGSAVVGSSKQAQVNALIDCFRRIGYRCAQVNPLHDEPPELDARLTLAGHGLGPSDLSESFATNGLLPQATASLQAIYDALCHLYLGSVGYDVGHVLDAEESEWLTRQIEQVLPREDLPATVRERSLEKLVQADTLERYLDKKYVGQKRFSVEGTDALVPMIDRIVTRAAEAGTKEIVLGMAHRGRVNVLINNLGMNPGVLYEDFEGPKEFGSTSGDLKYHRGFSNDVKTAYGLVHFSLLFNPSHLEYIAPVVMGSVRARQERHPGVGTEDYALPIVVHGDSAFSGEGVVMEAMNMSQLRAYRVGGAIQIVTNNQIGFTTCDHRDTRTSFACTDVAKLIDAPVFHVNADDLDAVQKITDLAFAYRMRFHKNVVIDLMGYRRHGHQEADEPSATSPLLYKRIRAHERSAKIYAGQLVKQGVVSQEQVDAWEAEQRRKLDASETIVDCESNGLSKEYREQWERYIDKGWREPVSTTYPEDQFKAIAKELYSIPDDFKLQKQVGTMIATRQKMAAGELPMDWGFGEAMAFATLLKEGHGVRLVGQDSRRGTFSHRHSSLFDQETGEELVGLRRFANHHDQLAIYDSTLNEAGALGFEYGHGVAESEKLVMWEAQFGDFFNPAQVVVDQFISSGWQKWKRLCGLVMLLPHGQEGQGPEHTSARLERFLQLAAQENIQIFVPSTPAQIFHLLRRQVLRAYRRPLVVMTPKSLLRNKLAVSTFDDCCKSELQLVIPEQDEQDIKAVKRVVLCCGKVYFDLLAERRKREQHDVALVRVEQLYPFPYEELAAELSKYAHAKEIVWCQEEPKNQGPWFTTRHRLLRCMEQGQQLAYAGREPFAAPASGFLGLHKQQQAALIDQALNLSQDLFAADKSGRND
jgi:2-oxoglutarate dehydrogenase E1 component